jgi:hypothetical protein
VASRSPQEGVAHFGWLSEHLAAGVSPFFLVFAALIPTVSCLPIIPQKPLFTRGDFFLPFLMIGDMY